MFPPCIEAAHAIAAQADFELVPRLIGRKGISAFGLKLFSRIFDGPHRTPFLS